MNASASNESASNEVASSKSASNKSASNQPAPSTRIRRAEAADADALALTGAATFLDTFAGILDGRAIVEHCRVQHAPRIYSDWLADPAVAAWLVETGSPPAPVGYALIAPPKLPLDDLDPSDLELKRIYLLSRFHGGGAGRELMNRAIAESRARGARRLLLGVYAGNERALAFYARNGFCKVGERSFQVGGNQYADDILALDLRR